MPVERQPLNIAGGDFDGTIGKGLFQFKKFQRIPRTSRIRILSVWYHAEPGANLATLVEFRLILPGGTSLNRTMLGTGTPEADQNADSSADVRLCGIDLPREPDDDGLFWDLQVKTTAKDCDAEVAVDYVVVEYPDTHERDSLR